VVADAARRPPLLLFRAAFYDALMLISRRADATLHFHTCLSSLTLFAEATFDAFPSANICRLSRRDATFLPQRAGGRSTDLLFAFTRRHQTCFAMPAAAPDAVMPPHGRYYADATMSLSRCRAAIYRRACPPMAPRARR